MAAKKTSAKKSSDSSVKVRSREGRTLGGGVDFDAYPSAAVAGAAAAVEPPMPDIPRPARTHVPIDLDRYRALKLQSKSAKKLSLRYATVKRDSKGARAEVAMMPAAAPVMAAAAAAPVGTPVVLNNFAGPDMGNLGPFDCTLAAGPSHVLASVNASVSVYDKTTGATVLTRSLATWFGGVISNAKIFDPQALYDQHAGRWVLVAVAIQQNPDRSWFLLSVSKTSDPTGGWFNYASDATKNGAMPSNNWADYPSLGVDNQALYVTANMFQFNGDFQYSKVRVIPKSGPYTGGMLTYSDIVGLRNADGSPAFTVQPCHVFGSPGVQYLVNSLFPDQDATKNQLTIWTIVNPLNSPVAMRSTVTTDPYALPPEATQKGGGTPLNTGDVRVLNAVFSGGTIWCAFTTRHVWTAPPNTAAIHWFQINPANNSVIQQGIYGTQAEHYYYPALTPDVHGNMIMVFSRSGASEFPSVYFTGRAATDPPGTLQNSTLLKAGVANYLRLDPANRNRWGDYAGIALDPVDSRSVRFCNGYSLTTNTWASWIGGAMF